MTTESANAIIHRWGSTHDRKLFIFQDRREEIVPYVHAVEEIQQTIESADSEDKRIKAESVLQIAVTRLVNEFCNILKVNTKPSSYTLSQRVINDLRSIAVRMDRSGFLHRCMEVYVSQRKHVLAGGLQHLNEEKLDKTSCQKLEWGVLDAKIGMWIAEVKRCRNYCFVKEKQLCEQIFHDLGDETSDSCFVETITDHTAQMLEIAEAFSYIPPTAEKLFRFLDLHDTLCDLLLPVIDNLELLRAKVVNQLIPKFADLATKCLLDFEDRLVNENSQVDHAEKIHPLSKNTMNYVWYLISYQKSLKRLSLPDLPSMDADQTISGSFLHHIVWIIRSLVSNLEVKSKLCKDPSAGRFFAMINFHYIIQAFKPSRKRREVVLEETLNKLVKSFQQARSDYLHLTFDVALKCLSGEGFNKTKILSCGVVKSSDGLKRLKGEFKKLEKDLRKVVVQDFRLVLELRELIVEMVVTAFTSFLARIPRLETSMKYSIEEIESAIQGFYVGR